MELRPHKPGDTKAIEELFVSVFTKAEGEEEGALIGSLSKELILDTHNQDLSGFVAVEGELIVGAIFFSRLTFEKDIDVFILAPVAIHNDYQGRGIGQALINHGLREMKGKGVGTVTTYGDPAFYAKVGFQPLSQAVIRPPYDLSQPEGWLGKSLTGDSIDPIPGSCVCAKALDNPVYW